MKPILAFLAGLILVIIVAVVYVQVSDVTGDNAGETVSEGTNETGSIQVDTTQAATPVTIPERSVDLTPPTPIERAPVAHAEVPPKVELPLRTQADLERMIGANRVSIDMCYSLGVMSNPSLSGTIVARITIEASGRVSDVQWTTNTLRDMSFEQCLRDEIRAWRFEPAADVFVGDYAFTFSR